MSMINLFQLERNSSAMEVGVQRQDLFLDLILGQVPSRVRCEIQ